MSRCSSIEAITGDLQTHQSGYDGKSRKNKYMSDEKTPPK